MTTVSQLNDQTSQPRPHSFLYCESCDGEYSANSEDYFSRSPDHVLTCCHAPLQHVTKTTHLIPVKE